jgi:hypothetical protein
MSFGLLVHFGEAFWVCLREMGIPEDAAIIHGASESGAIP